jgi:hypothetical protein
MSAFGTKQRWEPLRLMSAFGVKRTQSARVTPLTQQIASVRVAVLFSPPSAVGPQANLAFEVRRDLDAAPRQAFVARIQELEATLQAEREAFIARITELDRALQRFAKLFRWIGLPPLLAMRQRLRRKH